jgi:two-component sensor histidine kinase
VSSTERTTSYPIRILLLGFAVSVTAPLLALLGFLLYQSAAAERAQIESRLQQVATNVAEDIDRDIDRRIALLQTLATSPLVTEQNWPAFYRQAQAALHGRAYLVFTDSTGRQLVNTYVPFGTEPPFTGDPETIKRMLASKQPIVSDLFISLVVKRPVYNISIPVLRDGGEVRYVMSLGLLPEDLLSILKAQNLDAPWVLSVWDRNDAILARTRNHEAWVGKMLPVNLRASRWSSGVSRSTSLDNEPIVRAVAKSISSEWRVSVSVPVAIAERSVDRTMRVLAILTALVSLLAGLFGYFGGRFLSTPLVQAAAAAKAFGNGQGFQFKRTGVNEVNALSTALSEAAQRQQLLSRELIHRCKNILAVVQSIVRRSLGDGRSLAEVRDVTEQRLHALARAHDLVLKHDWRGADLMEIALSELEPFGNRIEIDGGPFTVMPDLVQPLMLVFHELATNAVKYGALSVPDGRVLLSWTATSAPRALLIEWRERDGPVVAAASRNGFGSRLLERAVPNATTKLDYDPAGFSYMLDIALSETPSVAASVLHEDPDEAFGKTQSVPGS